MIPQETIEQIRQATDIAQIIGEYVRLKKKGRNFEALCPFHTEKTPSFKVNTERQIYHCFGCGKGGNVFTFLMEHEKMSFVEAVRHLAAKANIIIREEVSDIKREQLERLNYAHQVALEYFHKVLHEPKYKRVLDDYLKIKRGITENSIEQFQLGLAGESWDGLIRYATGKDLKIEDLEKAGLIVRSEKGQSYHDRFRLRLMFPIFNFSSKPIAFGGRALKRGEPAKYINSPETPLYNKSNVLYGLNMSRHAIRETRSVFVVEGYFDLISLWQTGVLNVVASSGTAFSHQQARLLARFAENVYLFFDADSAGQQAALRSVDALFDAGLEVRVIVPPEGEDPDSIARASGRDGIEVLQDDALRYIPFRIKGLELDNAGIIVKDKLIKELSSLGGRISDPIRRALFIQEAADALGVNVTLFRTTGATQPTSQSLSGTRQRGLQRIEFEFLSLLLSNPGLIDTVLEQILPDDFDSKQLSRLYSAMISQYQKGGFIDANRLVEYFQDEDSVSLLTELAAVDWDQTTVEREIRDRIRDFVERKKKKIRLRLQKELAQAEANGDQDEANRLLEKLKNHGL